MTHDDREARWKLFKHALDQNAERRRAEREDLISRIRTVPVPDDVLTEPFSHSLVQLRALTLRAIAPGRRHVFYGPRRQVPSDSEGAWHPCGVGNWTFSHAINWPSPETIPLMGYSPAGVEQRVPFCQDSTAVWTSTTPISRSPSRRPRNIGRFGYVLRLQFAVMQVSTSTISITCADLRTSYQLNALRHRTAKSKRVAERGSLPFRTCTSCSTSSRLRRASSARRSALIP